MASDNEKFENIYISRIKPILDGFLSFAALVILSPLFVLTGIAVFLDDPGPIFFRQTRVGKDKEFFTLHKFRTMKVAAPHDVPTHQLVNPEKYITRVGKVLRRTSLDELPQIWDIFRGKMSIIGPRPALWNQDDLIEEREKYGANNVLPGLTGLAQIEGRDRLDIPEKAALDGEYIERLRKGGLSAFFFDCKMFLRTIGTVLRHDGVVEGSVSESRSDKKMIYKGGSDKVIAVLSSHTPSLFWFRLDLMQEFQKRGYKVYAVGNEAGECWKERFDELGILYKHIKVSRNGTNPIKDLQCLRSIVTLFREIKPDKIFTFQAKTVIYGGIASKIAGVKEVYPLLAGVGSAFLSNDLKSKIIRMALVAGYRLSMRNAKSIFLQNSDDVETFTKYGVINNQHKIVMIPGSGVNTEHFYVTPLPDVPTFLCISRLIKDKGIYEYVEACRRIKKQYVNVRCMLVGPYDSNPSAISPKELDEYISDGIIEYFGGQEDVRPYIRQCSVYVLPSYREGTPKTVLESMSSGRAVITTDAPGCRETVVDGENGLLVPVKDVSAIAEAMKVLIENSDMVKSMGKDGRRKAMDRFDVRIVNDKICETMGL